MVLMLKALSAAGDPLERLSQPKLSSSLPVILTAEDVVRRIATE